MRVLVVDGRGFPETVPVSFLRVYGREIGGE